jgi:hypothetical protein
MICPNPSTGGGGGHTSGLAIGPTVLILGQLECQGRVRFKRLCYLVLFRNLRPDEPLCSGDSSADFSLLLTVPSYLVTQWLIFCATTQRPDDSIIQSRRVNGNPITLIIPPSRFPRWSRRNPSSLRCFVCETGTKNEKDVPAVGAFIFRILDTNLALWFSITGHHCS